MSSAGRAENSNGCVTRPKGRGIGLSAFAAQIQLCSLTGSYVMATAEHREPYESRGSRTDLGARGGEIPPRDSTFSIEPPAASSPVMSVAAPIATEFCAPQRTRSVPIPVLSRCSNVGAEANLLNHLVGGSEKRRRHGKSEHPGGRMVDDKLEPR
jgi:hypothetical protein